MLLANLDQITAEYLQSICTDSYPETSTLEFKLTLPAPVDKHELMKDICALANADGGDLVYGVAEADGAASKVIPLDGTAIDGTKRRILQTIDNIEPRIHGVQVHPVEVDGGVVIVARVPASFDGPHSYRVGEARRFVMRNGTLTTDMSSDQIRTAFDRTASLAERARQFIYSRMRAAAERKTWKPIIDGPVCVAMIVPIAGFAGRSSVDIGALNNGYSQYMHTDWGGVSRTMNIDGLAVYPNALRNGQAPAFTQVYRNGPVEAVRYGGRLVDDKPVIPAGTIVQFYRDALTKGLKGMQLMSFSGPAIVQFALMTVGEHQLPADLFSAHGIEDSARRDLILPDTWIDELSEIKTDEQIDALLLPAMDVLWQAFDFERCFEFSLAGRFAPNR